ncbi:hypothetical protein [Chitinimonas sp.]|uniref:FFLEELY motif protein n=1 Tax=Chitinimonas sp. TaxID=1934313 RepID=UPI0035B15E42
MNTCLEQSIAESGLSRPHYLLAQWQAERLRHSYADLCADPRFAPATEFFLQDLYGPRDFSKRDHDGERVVSKMQRLLPQRAMAAIQSALHLNRLTRELDQAMVSMLFDHMAVETISADSYAQAYRLCGNRALREEQISLVDALGHELDVVVKKPLVQMALKLAHGPAHLAGLGELQDFLERGVAAFLHMNGADSFLATIARRERAILARIFSGAADPFAPESATGDDHL